MGTGEFIIARVTIFQQNTRVNEGKVICVREVFSWISHCGRFHYVSWKAI